MSFNLVRSPFTWNFRQGEKAQFVKLNLESLTEIVHAVSGKSSVKDCFQKRIENFYLAKKMNESLRMWLTVTKHSIN